MHWIASKALENPCPKKQFEARNRTEFHHQVTVHLQQEHKHPEMKHEVQILIKTL